MHISKIHYEIKCPTMQFGNEVLFVEYTLNEGDSADEAMKAAREFVWANHKQNNAHLYADQETKVSDIANAVIENKQRPKSQVEGMIVDMQSVTDLTVLKTYEKLASMSKNQSFMEAYQLKLNQLTNG